MTERKRLLINIVKHKSTERISENTLDWMFREGIINIAAVEAMAIRDMVERRVAHGEGKMRAIEEVAYRHGFSFEKVRHAVYKKIKEV
ncbi:MAG: hypothetical protein IKA70_04680 [Alistipes sp.]|nr:hypothetical protein [Alistipes sp.]